jgi:hypothetical protein
MNFQLRIAFCARRFQASDPHGEKQVATPMKAAQLAF